MKNSDNINNAGCDVNVCGILLCTAGFSQVPARPLCMSLCSRWQVEVSQHFCQQRTGECLSLKALESLCSTCERPVGLRCQFTDTHCEMKMNHLCKWSKREQRTQSVIEVFKVVHTLGATFVLCLDVVLLHIWSVLLLCGLDMNLS